MSIYTDRNYGEVFSRFDVDSGWNPHARLINRVALELVGLDADQPDDDFGVRYVFCASHKRAHATGWCTVKIDAKCPLEAEDREAAHREAVRLFGDDALGIRY